MTLGGGRRFGEDNLCRSAKSVDFFRQALGTSASYAGSFGGQSSRSSFARRASADKNQLMVDC
jgi:hypothetical protein